MLPVTTMLPMLTLVLYVGITWVIWKKYRLTRNLGFLVLWCGVLAWPMVGGMLGFGIQMGVRRMASGDTLRFFPFFLIKNGQITIGELLVLSSYVSRIVQA